VNQVRQQEILLQRPWPAYRVYTGPMRGLFIAAGIALAGLATAATADAVWVTNTMVKTARFASAEGCSARATVVVALPSDARKPSPRSPRVGAGIRAPGGRLLGDVSAVAWGGPTPHLVEWAMFGSRAPCKAGASSVWRSKRYRFTVRYKVWLPH
jgi:hypothetical protein